MTHLYWVALKSIWAKEINRFMRIWVQTLVPPVITMTLYFIIFGNLIGSRIGEMHGFTYMQFIVPGHQPDPDLRADAANLSGRGVLLPDAAAAVLAGAVAPEPDCLYDQRLPLWFPRHYRCPAVHHRCGAGGIYRGVLSAVLVSDPAWTWAA